MKSLLSKLALFIIGSIMIGCAAFGSRNRIYDDLKIKKIRSVGLVTKRLDQQKAKYHTLIRKTFNRNLLLGLDMSEIFQIVILDTLDNENLDIMTFESNADFDAILLVEWKFFNPNNIITNSKVTLSLIDRTSKQSILVSSYSTQFGNMYWKAPFMPRTLIDATDGAINAMKRAVIKNR